MRCNVPQLVRTMLCPQIFHERDPYVSSAAMFTGCFLPVSLPDFKQLPVPVHSWPCENLVCP